MRTERTSDIGGKKVFGTCRLLSPFSVLLYLFRYDGQSSSNVTTARSKLKTPGERRTQCLAYRHLSLISSVSYLLQGYNKQHERRTRTTR